MNARAAISLTQSDDRRAASRNPRARSMRVSAAVMRLLMLNFGSKARIAPLSLYGEILHTEPDYSQVVNRLLFIDVLVFMKDATSFV